MLHSRLLPIVLLLGLLPSTSTAAESPASATFSAQAEALPFPPDAREVEFDAAFDDIEFSSGSSLAALVDYYRKQMAQRGWTEDESAFESDEESAELTFQHDDAEIVMEFDVGSEEVTVSMDCEGLDFAHASDPAALIAAGVPQPRAYVFLQKLPHPAEIQDEEYSNDSRLFKSRLSLQELFDFYGKAAKAAGWRESRKPIITSDRRYTEFTRGPEEVSVNVFAHEIGSRIVLGYESKTKEPVVPPLPDPLAGLAKTPAGKNASPTAPAGPVRIGVDVSKNKGAATITLEGKKYTLTHAAAYRAKQNGEDTVQLLFADKPIPLARLQELLHTEDDVDMSDLFESSWPGHIRISVGQYISFSFNSGGVGVGNSIDDPVNELKITKDRVTGTLKMREPIEVFDDKMFVETTIDAALLTPNTRVAN